MIGIYEFTGAAAKRTVKDGFETLEAAEAYATANFNILFMERDADNVDCADLFTKSGMVFAIQPVDFQNKPEAR